MEIPNTNIVKDGLLMLHPIRWKILTVLKAKNRELYIDEIADLIEEDRRLVSFHLGILQERGFLESEFKVLQEPKSKGKAGRFFRLTDKFDKVRPELAHLIEG